MALPNRAIAVYQQEGFFPLLRRSKEYFLKSSLGDPLAHRLSRNAIRRRKKAETELDDILDTVLDINPGYGRYVLHAAQLREEIEGLARVVKEHNPETILEVGTANGGTLYVWCRYIDSAEKVISLDLPGGEFGGGYNEREMNIFRDFCSKKDSYFVRADSHEQATLETIRNDVLNDGETVDFLLIDGDHTYEGVKQDFKMYRELVADDGIIAFHDIIRHPNDKTEVEERRKHSDAEERHLNWSVNYEHCNVDPLWEEIQREYRTEEIISHPDQSWGGIGIVYLE